MRTTPRTRSARVICASLALLWCLSPAIAAHGHDGNIVPTPTCSMSTPPTVGQPADSATQTESSASCCCCPPTECGCCASLSGDPRPTGDDTPTDARRTGIPRSETARASACLCARSAPPVIPPTVEIHVPLFLSLCARTTVVLEDAPVAETTPRPSSDDRTLHPAAVAVHPPPERAPPRA